MSYRWYDFVGNVGVFCVLLAYLLLQLGRLSTAGLRYGLLNAVGAMLILVSLTQRFNLSSVIIEVCWLTISLIGIVRSLLRQRQ